jgi:hypothetical protein
VNDDYKKRTKGLSHKEIKVSWEKKREWHTMKWFLRFTREWEEGPSVREEGRFKSRPCERQGQIWAGNKNGKAFLKGEK